MNKLIYLMPAVFIFILSSCDGAKKNTDTNQNAKANTPVTTLLNKLAYCDTINAAITQFDNRLDIKMKRKYDFSQKGITVTYQKYFEFGDTTRLVKLRKEILTNERQMDVVQFHFVGGSLVEIHDYFYDKDCGTPNKQCATENKYYFKGGKYYTSLRRSINGTDTQTPVIENAILQPFAATEKEISQKLNQLGQINSKYATLPYPIPKK